MKWPGDDVKLLLYLTVGHWAVGFKKNNDINKNTQAALIQMLGCHDFQNAAGQVFETKFLFFSLSPFLWHPANSHVLLLSLHHPTVFGSCSVVVTIPRPWLLQLPRRNTGGAQGSAFCAIKLPAFTTSHVIRFHEERMESETFKLHDHR